MISLGSALRSHSRDYFVSSNWETPESVGWLFPIADCQVRYLAAAGIRDIGRLVHHHELRHLYVKTLIDGGVLVLAVSKLARHSDSKTTERWYYDLTAEQRRGIQERMPY